MITNAKSENLNQHRKEWQRSQSLRNQRNLQPAEIDEDGFILVTGKNAARRPQQQIQPQQAARGQPTTQYEVLSSDEDDEE
jgi:hypothetical protein